MQKRSGEVYDCKWEEPDPIRVKPPKTCAKECDICSKTLTIEDKSSLFLLFKGEDRRDFLDFSSFYKAKAKTVISISALRNACEKENTTIT